jgi:glycosyltransferase involved in cell wall biosynthesis
MKSHLLTAVIPVGEEHLAKNRIKHWVAEANKFSSELKLVIVFDSEKSPPSSHFEDLNLSNFEIIQGNFGSPGSARNAGQVKVNSKWLCFWDCDDEPNIESFLEMVKAAEISGYELAIGNYEIATISEIDNSTVYSHGDSLGVVANSPGIWRVAFSQKVYGDIRFEDLRMAEDQIYVLDGELPRRKIHFDQAVVYKYLSYESGQLTTNTEALKEIVTAIKLIKKRITSGELHIDKFSIKILTKIYLTAIKKGSLTSKMQIILDYFKFILIDRSVRIPMLKATIEVLSNKYNRL